MNKKITIVIPCLNEGKVIGEVIRDSWIGLGNDKINNQVLIIDSGTDDSEEIAKSLGADVLKTPKRGLGRAYIDAIPHIKGDYVVMGDADGTYDFKETPNFTKKLDEGYEYVMGTRTKGWIEKGSRPPLHRFFGAPVTNWIFNLVYGSNFSDIHCGMRAMTKVALVKMKLKSQSWQYASEMIIKAMQLGLKTTEVPIRFYKDKHGRIPHLRQGWLTPWKAGWISLQMMFTHRADFFLFRPGILLLFLGLLAVVSLSFGPVYIFSIHFMLLGMTLTILGAVSIFMGLVAKAIYDPSGKKMKKYMKFFQYNKSFLASLVLIIIGIFFTLPLVSDFISFGYNLSSGLQDKYYLSVTGLTLIIIAFVNFTFTLLLHSLSERLQENQ
ncbi:MAG: glycosyltransferase family 2 protein [Candidatus Moranbacteria bacterium]|nr:glycosyltransferase family 2 protein [Candidatus Moranbacteria bacterium]